MADQSHDVTRLLHALAGGDRGAGEALARLVYDELHELAEAAMRRERATHTWQTTELLHEAYIRLLGAQPQPAWADRAHFYGVAARVMRRLLVDHARARHRHKRDGGRQVTLDEQLLAEAPSPIDLLELDAALERLAAADERPARVVELRFFGGLSLEEVAEVLGLSLATVKRDWTFARALLRAELDPVRAGGG